MADIQDVVNDQMKVLVEDGTIEKLVRERLVKSVADSLDSCMRSYSAFGKALEEEVENSLKVELKNLNIDEYAHGIKQMVESMIGQHYVGEAQAKLKKQLDDMFEPAPDKISLSQLVEAYKEHLKEENSDTDGEYFLLLIEKGKNSYDKDWLTVAFNPMRYKRDYSSYASRDSKRIGTPYECEIRLHVKDTGEFRWADTNESKNTFLPFAMRGLARKLFQMYCHGTMLEFDQGFEADAYDTSIGADY